MHRGLPACKILYNMPPLAIELVLFVTELGVANLAGSLQDVNLHGTTWGGKEHHKVLRRS